MRSILRPSIFRYLLFILIAACLVVAAALMLANQAVHQATQSLEEVVEYHVRPLAAVYRLQSHMDTLRGLEIELHQFNDFFAVPYHLNGMEREIAAIDEALTGLQRPFSLIESSEADRLITHWEIYHAAVSEEIRLARAMQVDDLAAISATRTWACTGSSKVLLTTSASTERSMSVTSSGRSPMSTTIRWASL